MNKTRWKLVIFLQKYLVFAVILVTCYGNKTLQSSNTCRNVENCYCDSEKIICDRANLTNIFRLSKYLKQDVKIISLTNCSIRDLSFGAFVKSFNVPLGSGWPTRDLRRLNVSGNFIYESPTRLLQYLPKLEKLDLSNNDLRTLTTDDIKAYSSLRHLYSLRLRDNPYDCSCPVGHDSMSVILKWMNSAKYLTDSDYLFCNMARNKTTIGQLVKNQKAEDICEPEKVIPCDDVKINYSATLDGLELGIGIFLIIVALSFAIASLSRYRCRDRKCTEMTLSAERNPEITSLV